MNNVALIGRMVRDPELRFVAGTGTAVTKFTLAVDRKLSKEKKSEYEQQGKPTADFIRVVVWGKTAEAVANHGFKGQLVGVKGSIETGSYQDESGRTIYTTDVRADAYGGIEFLEWHGGMAKSQADGGAKSQRKSQDGYGFGDFGFSEDPDDDCPF